LYRFDIFKSYHLVNSDHWNSIIGDNNIYLSLKYLSALEDTLKDQIRFHYILFYKNQKEPIGVAITQTLTFIDKGFTENEQICKIRNKIKKRFVTGDGTKILTCGNPFASGENGFYFLENHKSKTTFKLLHKAIHKISKEDKTPVILFKEFWSTQMNDRHLWNDARYTGFEIDVNMVMPISEKWKNRADYYDAMNTKFRSKAKNAYHKSHDIQVKNFQNEDIERFKEEILNLYLSVVGKSPFDYGNLNSDTFYALKKNLKEDFIVKGYFYKEKLVGFSSAFVFDSVLDANFVGINYELNNELAIYQRMLYDFVDHAILNQCKEIRFGRTAEEIKSSIGAKPVNMILFIKHKNILTNLILKSIIGKNKPSEFSLRKPFKLGV
jgi:hypothetical protein